MPTPNLDDHDDNDIGLDVIGQAASNLGVKLPNDPAFAPRKAEAGRDTDQGDHNDDDLPEAPEREEGESDEDYRARLEEAGLDPDDYIQPQETDEERMERLQQQPGESDEDYEARLAEEGLTRDDVALADEQTEEQKKAAAAKARDEADLKKLPEAVRKTVQGILDKRIGKITAKAKEKEAELTTRLAELETRLAEAREAAEGKPAKATLVSTVHPLLLDPSEDAIAKYVEGIEAFEDWAAEHEDGFEPTAEQLAQGYRPATRAEIRTRLRALQRERDKLVPQAREILAKRATADAEARKIIPAFFDATKPEYQAARSLLREQPELKRFPDYMTRAAEIVLGRKALADLKTAAAKPKSPIKPAARAPRAPGGGSAAKGGLRERLSRGSDAPVAVRDFVKNPTRETLASVAGQLLET